MDMFYGLTKLFILRNALIKEAECNVNVLIRDGSCFAVRYITRSFTTTKWNL